MTRYLSAALVLGLSAGTALAQAPKSGFRAEFLNEMAGLEKRVASLAEQMPADKYTWRPAEGVRSVSEVFLHIAAANFSIPRMFGTPPPEGLNPRGYDTSTTDRAKIVETLKQSFAHVRQAAMNVSDADVEKPIKLFGSDSTYRGAMMFMARHLGEHLGQSIAYARMNGVTPPWTEEAQQRQRQQQKKSQ